MTNLEAQRRVAAWVALDLRLNLDEGSGLYRGLSVGDVARQAIAVGQLAAELQRRAGPEYPPAFERWVRMGESKMGKEE